MTDSEPCCADSCAAGHEDQRSVSEANEGSDAAVSGGADSVRTDGGTVRLSVPDMDCPSCASTVGNALDDVGVEYETSPTTGQVTIPGDADRSAVVAAIERAGYDVTDVREAGDRADMRADPVWRSPRAIKTGLAGLFAVLALAVRFGPAVGLPAVDIGLFPLGGGTFTVSDALFAASVASGGEVIVRNGWGSIRTRSLDIDFLMTAAIVAAVGITLFASEELWIEAASLAVLFNVAELLERHSVDRARNSLAELLDLSPETAVVVRGDQDDSTDEAGDAGAYADTDERMHVEDERGRVEHERGRVEVPVGDVAVGERVEDERGRVEVPVGDVAVGERVVVEPGAKIPLDGTVVEGQSAVNQAPVTGESVPVDKTVGDEVYAGTINEQGYLEVEVTARSDDSTLSRVIDLVSTAQERQTDREQFVERFARYYTPIVVTLAVLVAAVPPLAFGAPAITWVVRGIALLVIACPCAFVISTPVTVVSGVTSAAKRGVLVKGGDHLERMSEVDTVAFDKTGTLTTGDLAVTDVVPLNGHTESDVLRCARGLERRSEHPIADAVTAHADDEPPGTPHVPADTPTASASASAAAPASEPASAAAPASTSASDPEAARPENAVSGFESLTGQGVRAELGGHTHYAGTPALFEDLGVDLSHVHFTTDEGDLPADARSLCDREGCLDLLEDVVPRLQAEGKTVVLVGTAETVEGVIAVADTVREEAQSTVAALHERGVRTVMLTGDNEGTARAVADAVGVDEFRASLLPEEKVDAIESLQSDGGHVAFVGDGINDAPALATADVGIAMGAAGSDTAIETADVALLGDDLSRLPYLVTLSRRANRVIRQNVTTSLAAKAALAVLVPVAPLLGWFEIPLWVVVLVGDVGMTSLVTGNAMRLTRLGG